MTTPTDIGTLIEIRERALGPTAYIVGTGISVLHILALYDEGYSPEAIPEELFGDVSVGQVYAALAYYHLNREWMDDYIRREAEEHDRLAALYPRWPAAQPGG